MRLLRKSDGADNPTHEPDPDELKDTPEALRESVAKTVDFINRHAGQLPTSSVVNALWVTDTLSEVIDTSEFRPLDVYAVISVRNTLEDYLPTTLQRYLAIPEDARLTARATGRNPADSLADQIFALQTAAAGVLTGSQDQDVDALMTQGAFLSTKFDGSDLDL